MDKFKDILEEMKQLYTANSEKAIRSKK